MKRPAEIYGNTKMKNRTAREWVRLVRRRQAIVGEAQYGVYNPRQCTGDPLVEAVEEAVDLDFYLSAAALKADSCTENTGFAWAIRPVFIHSCRFLAIGASALALAVAGMIVFRNRCL